MLRTAAVLLGIAAAIGMTLAGIRLARDPYPPAALAMAHGLAAGAALTLLIYAACTAGISKVALGAIALLLAAAGLGTWLNLGFHARQRAIPIGAMTAHALIAVTGFAALLAALAGF